MIDLEAVVEAQVQVELKGPNSLLVQLHIEGGVAVLMAGVDRKKGLLVIAVVGPLDLNVL